MWKSRPLAIGVSALVVLALGTGCSGDAPSDASTPTAAAATTTPVGFDVRGYVDVESDFTGNLQAGNNTLGGECLVERGFDDIRAGAQAAVLDETGATVGVGRVEALVLALPNSGTTSLASAFCRATFSVRDVPAGHGFYSVQIANRDPYRLTETEARARVELTLGDIPTS